MRTRTVLSVLALAVTGVACSASSDDGALATNEEALLGLEDGELVPTGARITPTAAPGAVLTTLNPDLPSLPGYVVGQATVTAKSPDGKTLLVLTSGYNRVNGADGKTLPEASTEFVFVFDVSGDAPVKTQVLPLANTFHGVAWAPAGDAFYVTGGVDDVLHVFTKSAAATTWSESASIPLGHGKVGLGLGIAPAAAGVSVTADGKRAVVANFENDSITVVDLVARAAVAEIDLRPGKVDAAQRGVAGGEYPFDVAVLGNDVAYVTSQRDDEVVVVGLAGTPGVRARIAVGDQPNRLLLRPDGRRLFVANGNADTVAVIDTKRNAVVETIRTTAPFAVYPDFRGYKGANPNSLALSPDGRTLFVTNGGLNAVAVIRLADDDEPWEHSATVGLIPTGWYPNSVSVSADGRRLFVVNGKSNTGPNAGACRDSVSGSSAACNAKNAYVWQLTKAGFLTLPIPSPGSLARLTLQTAQNNRFPITTLNPREARAARTMRALRERIRHVVYIVKENRTYDQVLGDLGRGNGDPSLTVFPEPLTPNHHALARTFVTLDAFRDSGEVSGDGWNWTTAARTSDFTEKTVSVNYAGRGLCYDWEGTDRNINVAHADLASRVAADPATPADPDLLPGTVDVAATPAAGEEGEEGATAYLWDAALRRGLSVRNYGFFGDLTRNNFPATDPNGIPLERTPAASALTVFYPAKPSLLGISDPYFRGYDNKFPDYWRFQEWKREFDAFAESGDLPALELVRFPHDHFGDFGAAIDGVNTPDRQMADNDYAVGMLVDTIAKSRFAKDTVVVVVEDDAQNGGDHVDAHRSVAFFAGAYVKQGAVVSTPYDTVNMVRTIEDLLGAEPMGLTDGLAAPMADVFDLAQTGGSWGYDAIVPEVLRTTALPLPAPAAGARAPSGWATSPHDAAWWEEATRGQDFHVEDHLDAARFNAALWEGLKGQR